MEEQDDCANHLPTCQEKYGKNSTLMDFPTQDIIADVMHVAQKYVMYVLLQLGVRTHANYQQS